jgi:FkbM family methyltransferase
VILTKTAIINLIDNNKIVVPDDNRVITTFVLREQEDWFENEIRFVRKLAFQGMKSIDIGASYGIYSLALARLSGKNGKVYAFEPTPATADCLSESISLNSFDNIQLNRVAVSSESGVKVLCLGESSELNSLKVDNKISGETIKVETVSLDDFIRSNQVCIDFIKIDAEDHEAEVYSGGSCFFRDQSPLVMYEVSDNSWSSKTSLCFFDNLGYKTFKLIPGLNILAPVSVAEYGSSRRPLNLFCCKDDKSHVLESQGLLLLQEFTGDLTGCIGSWEGACKKMPAFSDLIGLWSHMSKSKLSIREIRYLEVLDLIVYSESETNPPDKRYSALNKAFRYISMLCDVSPTVPRLTTYARVCSMLGYELETSNIIQRTLDIYSQADIPCFNEPFFLPSARFDYRQPNQRIVSYVFVTLFEELQRWYCYSTYFCPEFFLSIIDDIKSKYILTPELERRRQLARMYLGIQHAPKFSDATATFSDDNTNFEYWSDCT